MEKTCAELIREKWESVESDLEKFSDQQFADLGDLDSQDFDPETWEEFEALGSFHNYGLDFSWVEPTRDDAGHYCYLLCTGGPHEELNFYGNGGIEFVYKDWFDCAELGVTDSAYARELRDYLAECGSMPRFEGLF